MAEQNNDRTNTLVGTHPVAVIEPEMWIPKVQVHSSYLITRYRNRSQENSGAGPRDDHRSFKEPFEEASARLDHETHHVGCPQIPCYKFIV